MSRLYRDLRALLNKDDAYRALWMPDTSRDAQPSSRAAAMFEGIQGRILRAYGLLTLKPTAYFEAGFGIDTLSYAFLQLWSVVSLLKELFITDRLEGPGENYRIRVPGKVEGVVSWVERRRHGHLSGVLGAWSLPKTKFEAVLLTGVLVHLGEENLADQFSRSKASLRGLRNDLEVIHGNHDARVASLEDILTLTQVLRALLLIDQRAGGEKSGKQESPRPSGGRDRTRRRWVGVLARPLVVIARRTSGLVSGA